MTALLTALLIGGVLATVLAAVLAPVAHRLGAPKRAAAGKDAVPTAP